MCSSNRHREWNIRIIFGADVIGPTAWVSLLTWRLDFWRARSNMREFLPSTPEPLGVSGGAPIFRSVDLSLRREWSSAAKSSPSAGDTSSPRRQAVVTSSAHHQPAGAPPTSHPVQAFRSVMVLWTVTLDFSRARRGNCKSILKHETVGDPKRTLANHAEQWCHRPPGWTSARSDRSSINPRVVPGH